MAQKLLKACLVYAISMSILSPLSTSHVVSEILAAETIQLGDTEEAWWKDSHTATWKTVKQAKEYQVRLFENGVSIVRLATSTNQLDLKNYMKDGNDYYFAVRAVPATGEDGYKKAGEWVESNDQSMTIQGITGGRWKDYLEGRKYMLEDGSYISGDWARILGSWYYFQQDGYILKGWYQEGDHYYYLNMDQGVMTTGWDMIDGNWYYFDKNGKMVTGWIEDLPRHWYYLGEDGVLAVSSWIDNYYVDENGLWTP